MEIRAIFFDLDGTLYSDSSGLWSEIKNRIDRYLLEVMGFQPEQAARLRNDYLERYGTTLRGLQLNHHIDAEDYLRFVHDIPLEKYLKPDEGIRSLVSGLRRPYWIFTNSSSEHASRVLEALGVRELFPRIIDIRALDFLCKPLEEAYLRALQIAGLDTAEGVLLIEDSERNIAPALKLGFQTVYLSLNGSSSSAHQTVKSLHELPEIFPGLWK